MTTLTYIIGTIILGLLGAARVLYRRLKLAEDKNASLEVTLSQEEYDAEIKAAKANLEEVLKRGD